MSGDKYTIGDVLSDLVHGQLEFVPQDVAEKRLIQCHKCQLYNQRFALCSVCGCFMPVKVRLVKSTCPVDFWEKYDG